jgi:hypothetical protein
MVVKVPKRPKISASTTFPGRGLKTGAAMAHPVGGAGGGGLPDLEPHFKLRVHHDRLEPSEKDTYA